MIYIAAKRRYIAAICRYGKDSRQGCPGAGCEQPLEFMLKNYLLKNYRTHRKIDPESGYFKPKQDCKYPFAFDLAPIGILIGAKFIGKG